MTALSDEAKISEHNAINESSTAQSKGGSVRLVIYDFDQTITTKHLYRELHGGRLKSLAKLSDDKLVSLYGGQQRITLLNDHFNTLCAAQIEVGIVSFGWSEVIARALERVHLGQYFKENVIIGRDSKELVRFNKHKGKVIELLMKRRKLEYDQVLFVEDSLSNIAQSESICRTLHIEDRCGMTKEHMLQIESQIRLCSEHKLNGNLNGNHYKNGHHIDSGQGSGSGQHSAAEHGNPYETPVVIHGDLKRRKKSRSKLAKYQIKNVPKWFDDLTKMDEDTETVDIQDDADDNAVEIATDFTFALDVDGKE